VINGAQAVKEVKDVLAGGRDGSPFDLVLLDLHMPELDGYAAMREMRVAGYVGPIVGLTADFADKSPEQWLRDGWDAMAPKPVDRKTFIPLLARMIAGGQARPAPL
jgi:CheY-like chemotaxis protein